MKFFSEHRPTGKRGFTLVEVIVAASIVAILSSIVIANVGEGRKKARDTQRVSDIEQIRLALRLYKDAHGSFPKNSDGEIIEGKITPTSDLGARLTPYLSHVPEDPFSADDEYGYYFEKMTCRDSVTSTNVERYLIYAAKMEVIQSVNINEICTTPGNGVGNSGNGNGDPQGAAYGYGLDSAYGKSFGVRSE